MAYYRTQRARQKQRLQEDISQRTFGCGEKRIIAAQVRHSLINFSVPTWQEVRIRCGLENAREKNARGCRGSGLNTVRLNPFALRYRRAFPGFDTLAYPVLSLSKGQPERILFLTEQYWDLTNLLWLRWPQLLTPAFQTARAGATGCRKHTRSLAGRARSRCRGWPPRCVWKLRGPGPRRFCLFHIV